MSNSQHISLILDNLSHPHISYSVYDQGLKYAYWTGQKWQVQTVDENGFYASSIAIDTENAVHITYSYQKNGESQLRYAFSVNDEWSIQSIEDACASQHCFPQDISLVLDANDQAHLSYSDGWALMYAYQTNDNWNVQTVVNGGSSVKDTSLALDPLGNPYISYSAVYEGLFTSNSDLEYAYQKDDEWYITSVEATGFTKHRRQSSLAIDAFGIPHISFGYYDHAFQISKLKYATMPPPLLLSKQVTPEYYHQADGILTYTLTLSAAGLAVEFLDALPENVEYIANSITGTITPSAVYSDATRSIIWQGTLNNTTLILQFKVIPKLMGTGSIQDQAIVNTASVTDLKHNRVVSATAMVNGIRMYLPVILR